MAKFAPDAVLDTMLDDIATSVTMTACSGQPTDFAGIAAVTLAAVTLTGADFTKDNDPTSGRRLTVAEQLAVAVTATGTMTHLALDDGTALKLVTTTASVGVTSGGTVDLPAWTVSNDDPV